MRSLLVDVLTEYGIGARDVEVAEDPPCVSYPPFTWGGGLHRVPEDFVLPGGTLESVWVLWCCGDDTKKIPPYRFIHASDFAFMSL